MKRARARDFAYQSNLPSPVLHHDETFDRTLRHRSRSVSVLSIPSCHERIFSVFALQTKHHFHQEAVNRLAFSAHSAVNMSALADDSHVPDQLVDQLAKGYDALSLEMKRVHEHSRQLENKLSWAKQQASFPFISHPRMMNENISSRPEFALKRPCFYFLT
jgi:hypothetical protein